MIDLECPAAFTEPTEYFGQFRSSGPIQWSDRHRAWPGQLAADRRQRLVEHLVSTGEITVSDLTELPF